MNTTIEPQAQMAPHNIPDAQVGHMNHKRESNYFPDIHHLYIWNIQYLLQALLCDHCLHAYLNSDGFKYSIQVNNLMFQSFVIKKRKKKQVHDKDWKKVTDVFEGRMMGQFELF